MAKYEKIQSTNRTQNTSQKMKKTMQHEPHQEFGGSRVVRKGNQILRNMLHTPCCSGTNPVICLLCRSHLKKGSRL